MSLKAIKYSVLVFFILLTAGVAGWYFLNKNKLKNKSVNQPATRMIVKVAVGEIVSLSGASVKLLAADPDSENAQDTTISFAIDKRTEFYRYSAQTKSDAEFKQEVAEFNDLVKKSQEEGKDIGGLDPPSFFIQEKITPADIQAGQQAEAYLAKNDLADLTAPLARIIVKNPPAEPTKEDGAPTEVVITGKVLDTGSGRLSILLDNPEAVGSTSTEEKKEFLISASTKIFEKRRKPEKEYSAELQAFYGKLKEAEAADKNVAGMQPPDPFLRAGKTAATLKKGQKVEITADFDNLTNALEIAIIP